MKIIMPHPKEDSSPSKRLRIWLPLFIAIITIVGICSIIHSQISKQKEQNIDHAFSLIYNHKKQAITLKATKIDPTVQIAQLVDKGQYKHALKIANELEKRYDASYSNQTEGTHYDDTVKLTPEEERILTLIKKKDEERTASELAKVKWFKAQALLALGETTNAILTLEEINDLKSDFQDDTNELLADIRNKKPSAIFDYRHKISRKNK